MIQADSQVSKSPPLDDANEPSSNVVTPARAISAPNAVSKSSISSFPAKKSSLAPSDFKFLCEFLDLAQGDEDAISLNSFLSSVGIKSLNDLALLQEHDLKDSDYTLSLMTRRKLLRVAQYVLQGKSLQDVGSIHELLKSEHTAANLPADESIVNLNVGGYSFTTSRQTLCRVPNSLLESMFSGRHGNPARRDKDGSFVIDRNGTHFHHILDFLRVGAVVSLPSKMEDREALAREAEYFGLDEIVKAIRAPQIDTREYLSNEVLAIRNEEDMIRQAFVRGNGRSLDPHEGLVSLFSWDGGLPRAFRVKYEPFDKETNVALMDGLRKEATADCRVCVTSLSDFEFNFNKEFPNVLHRLSRVLLEEPVIIAGGSVLRALTASKNSRTASWWGEPSDIDLFLHCRRSEDACRIARRIFFALAVDDERWVVMRSRGVITMHNWVGREGSREIGLKVQIVLRLYDSPVEVLFGFDCDCCCCAYDGRSVWVTPRWLNAIRTGANILNPLHAWPNKCSYEFRLAKYAYRGFAVIVPGLERKLIDAERIRSKKLPDLKGLARLIKISDLMEAANSSYPQEPHYVDDISGTTRYQQDDTEVVMRGWSGYDDPIEGIIIPHVYGDNGLVQARDGAVGMMWFDHVGGADEDFPLAADCRESAWRDIAWYNDETLPSGVPVSLAEAWDTKKKSREYLNSEFDRLDLDSVYYGHAF